MMRFLRSQSQVVLVFILIVIGGSFLFYGNVGSLLTGSGGRGNDFGRIDGQDVSVAELYDAVRTTRDAIILSGHPEQLKQPDARPQLAKEAWTRLLLLHEAERLHIQVSDQEIVDDIQRQPEFQKNGVYSPELYQKAMGDLSDKLRISTDQFVAYIREQLEVEAVVRALFSTVRTAPGDVTAQYDKFEGQVHVSTVTIDPKTLGASVRVTPEQIEAEYKAHPDNPDYRTAEQRKVDYVLWPLTPEQSKLPAKEKSAAIEALGEKALDFALALQPDPAADAHAAAPPSFAAEAAKRGLTVATTGFFAVDAPPAGLPPSPTFNNAAFALTKDTPVSKVVELDSGVALLHLNDVQSSELKPLDQVKDDITRQLQQSGAQQQAQVTAQAISQALQSAVARGTDFKAAAAAQKLSVEVLPPFVPQKAYRENPRMGAVAYAALMLPVGGVSPPMPTENNNQIVIVHLDRRDPADPAGLAAFEDQFRARQDDEMRQRVSADWVDWMNHRRGTHLPPDLDQYGGVE